MKTKMYEVKISHLYLLPAKNETEAIERAKERFMGRNCKDVYFDGMLTSCDVTKRKIPKYVADPFELMVKEEKAGNAYGLKLNRDRKDSKEQDYIDLSSVGRI